MAEAKAPKTAEEQAPFRAEKFYAPFAKYSMSVPVTENGQPVLLLDGHGRKTYTNGVPMALSRRIEYDVVSDNPKVGYASSYVPKDKDELAACLADADNPKTKVMRERDWEKKLNPAAAKLKAQRDADRAAFQQEIVAERQRTTAFADENARLKEQLDAAEKKVKGGK